jgi:GDP-L-fucose synthase
MIRRFHEAKKRKLPEVVIWGTGSPKREFLHVDDLADASLFLMNTYNERSIVNVGTGVDVTIKKLAETVKKITGYTGKLTFDTTRPDGTPRKLLNMKKLHSLGWKHTIDLEQGIKKTYASFLKEVKNGTIRGYNH